MKNIKITRRKVLHIVIGGLAALPVIQIGWHRFRNRRIRQEVIFGSPFEYGYVLLEEMQRGDLEDIGGFAQIYQIYASKAGQRPRVEMNRVRCRVL